MLGEGDAAEQLYREAIERLGRTRISVALGRSRLAALEERVAASDLGD